MGIKGIPPQRQHLFHTFVDTLQKHRLSTWVFMLTLLQLRELRKEEEEFYEWGSTVAHFHRNQGWVWETAVSVWATQAYYATVNRNDVSLSPLPADILFTILDYVEGITDMQISDDFGDLFPGGINRKEILATIAHLYSATSQNKKREREAFLYLAAGKAIAKEDQTLMSRLILEVENTALNLPPYSLNDVLDALEKALLDLSVLQSPFTDEERIYLQLHALAAFHNQLLDINPNNFKELTGHDLDEKQAMLFVSSMGPVLSLDIGFFYLEDGKHLEPTEFYTTSHIDKLYHPVVVSNLNEESYLLESDLDIRVCLYNHPVEVKAYQGRHVLIALDRQASRYPPTKKR